jgi:hypothetical protein
MENAFEREPTNDQNETCVRCEFDAYLIKVMDRFNGVFNLNVLTSL